MGLHAIPSERKETMKTNSCDLVQNYRRDGFVIIRNAFVPQRIDELARLEEEVVAPFDGPLPRHDGLTVAHGYYQAPQLSAFGRSRCGLMNLHQIRNHRLQQFVEAFSELLTSPEIFSALNALYAEDRFTLHQTITFLVSPLTVTHIERMTVDTQPLGGCCTVWLPIDPIDAMNGPVYVVPRGQRDYHSDEELGIADAVTRSESPAKAKAFHREALLRKLKSERFVMVVPQLERGDLLIYAASTPHGSFPSTDPRLRRRSVQAIYRVTRFTAWGGYPFHDQPHSVAREEDVISDHFNFLRHS